MNQPIRVLAVFVSLLALAACGGGKTTTTSTTTNGTTAGTMGKTEAQREAGALPMGAAAPVDVNCGAVKPVWVNLHTKAYHDAGDPYYGKTKNGKYMCPSAANAAGFHPAGSRMHSGMNSGMNSSNASGDAMYGSNADSSMTNAPTTSGRKHHHRETMAPMSTPTP